MLSTLGQEPGSPGAWHLHTAQDSWKGCTSLSCFLPFQYLLPPSLLMVNNTGQYEVSSWGEELEKNTDDYLANRACQALQNYLTWMKWKDFCMRPSTLLYTNNSTWLPSTAGSWNGKHISLAGMHGEEWCWIPKQKVRFLIFWFVLFCCYCLSLVICCTKENSCQVFPLDSSAGLYGGPAWAASLLPQGKPQAKLRLVHTNLLPCTYRVCPGETQPIAMLKENKNMANSQQALL